VSAASDATPVPPTATYTQNWCSNAFVSTGVAPPSPPVGPQPSGRGPSPPLGAGPIAGIVIASVVVVAAMGVLAWRGLAGGATAGYARNHAVVRVAPCCKKGDWTEYSTPRHPMMSPRPERLPAPVARSQAWFGM
jgi:hypothetical protein